MRVILDGHRSSRPGPRRAGAVLACLSLVAAVMATAGPVAASEHDTPGMAVREGWPRLTGDLDTAAPLQPAIEGASGRSGWFKHSSPTVADLDRDGRREIVIGSLDGRLYVFAPDGSALPGWPRRVETASVPAAPINGTPAVGDVAGDNRLEIVVGTDSGWVFVFALDGTIVPGWPQFTGNTPAHPLGCATVACTGVVAGPTLADLDGDGKHEVVAGSLSHRLWVWRGNGSPLPGWPRQLYGPVGTSAAVGDLDGDGSPEIVVASDVTEDCADCPPFGALLTGGLVHAFRTDGSRLPGWPVRTDSFMTSSPALADLDGDGRPEVVVGGGRFVRDQHVRGHRLHALRPDGTLLWAFDTEPGASNAQPGGLVLASPAVGNVVGDARPEVAFGDANGGIFLLSPQGQHLWSKSLSLGGANGAIVGGPVLADVTGDGVPEVVAGGGEGRVKAWNGVGQPVADSSFLENVTRFALFNSPAVADLDGDGKNEIVVGSARGDGPAGDPHVAAGHGELWVLATNGTGVGPWPQFQSRSVPGEYHLYTGPVPPDAIVCTVATAGSSDLPAVFRGGWWYFRATHASGGHDYCIRYGSPGDVPVTGDWNNDAVASIGVFRPSEGRWYLTNRFDQEFAQGVFRYGSPGDIPVVGDWNNDGTDTLGVFRPSEGRWYLTNFLDRGFADGVFQFGSPGDIPVVGDWNDDGTDTLGVFRPSEGKWYLTDFFDSGVAERVLQFGSPGDIPVVGDWNNDGTDTLGVFRPGEGRWYLTNRLASGGAEVSFQFGSPGDVPRAWG